MKINDDLIGTVKNSTKWNNMENDIATTNDSDTWIPVLRGDKLQHTTIDSIVSRGIKSLNNGGVPRCFQLVWGPTLIANTEVGGHGLIMASNEVLYMFWIAGPNHDQLSVNTITIWGNSNYCQVTMTDNAHLKVTNTNGDNMTCSILFIGGN